jgi:hypothetical protein
MTRARGARKPEEKRPFGNFGLDGNTMLNSGSEIFAAVFMHSSVFWDITSYN